jgi:hypothetical protein
VKSSGVYRTGQGRTLRITESDDGALRVEILQDEVWTAGPIRMAGLRLSSSTRKLTSAEVLALPA